MQKFTIINEKLERERRYQFRNKVDKVVQKLRSKSGVNGPQLWEVVKKVKRKKVEPPTAIKSKDGLLLETPNEIQDRYIEHFKDILQPVKSVLEEERAQEEIVQIAFERIIHLAEQLPTTLTSEVEIENAIKELKKNKCKDSEGWVNEIVLNGGKQMSKSLHYLFNRLEAERYAPKEWKEVMIKTISKPGSVFDMNNKRGIFITEVISKIYERVLKNRNSKNIDKYISQFQTGGTKGRSTIDNTLILSEIIRKNRYLGRKTYLVFGDAIKCFDKLWLKDCLVEMFNAGCRAQDIQMMYLLNQDTEVTIVTPSSTTNKIHVGEIVKQEQFWGPLCVVCPQIK